MTAGRARRSAGEEEEDWRLSVRLSAEVKLLKGLVYSEVDSGVGKDPKEIGDVPFVEDTGSFRLEHPHRDIIHSSELS